MTALRKTAISMSVQVPVVKLANGRDFIADEFCVEFPSIAEFVNRFSNYWQRDVHHCGWVSSTAHCEDQAQK